MTLEKFRHWHRECEPDPADMAPVEGTDFKLSAADTARFLAVREAKLANTDAGRVQFEYDARKGARVGAIVTRTIGNGSRRNGHGISHGDY